MANIKTQAEKDAREWTEAKLAYGEGAGIRRKLINETVAYKMQHIPGYKVAFDAASERQDVASMAKHAKRNDRRKKVNNAVVRNTRAVATGKIENVSTGLLLVGAAAVVLHKTGADRKIIDFAKAKYAVAKRRWRKVATGPKPQGPNRDGVYNITDFR
jgi:hypothetical protein